MVVVQMVLVFAAGRVPFSDSSLLLSVAGRRLEYPQLLDVLIDTAPAKDS